MKRNLLKRATATLLMLTMLLGMTVALPVSADAEPTFDISIDSPEALATMQASIDALTEKTTVRIQLTTDIDMSGRSYMPVTTEKTVVFEGNRHKISNLSAGTQAAPAENAGLFAQIGVESSASNLTLENVNLHASKNAAGFAATAMYGNYEFYNVHVSGTITAHHPDKMGVDTGIAAGILGWIPCVGEQLGIATRIGISYCTNAANITADSAAGGLLGKLTGPAYVQASYCANTGNLTATGVADDARYFNGDVGGIVALIFHEWSTNKAWSYNRFENCYNTGDLSATTHATASTPSIGGITGVIRCYGIGSMSPKPEFENTLEYYNCFDYSKRTAIIPSTVPSTAPSQVLNYTHNAGIAGFSADSELPMKYFTNCYAVCKPDSQRKYEVLHSGGKITLTNSSVVETVETEIPLTTGTSTVSDMIRRIATAIAALDEIEMPVTVIDDGMPRDYSWYYANGSVIADKGTEAAPYEISSAAQLAALSALSNGHHDPAQVGGSSEALSLHDKHIKLTADIDMTGYQSMPINAKDATVTFDGNDKKISNWSIEKASNGGIFSVVGPHSTVKNLTLVNIDVNAYGESGTLIGLAKAGLTVYNVKTNAACKVETAGRVGGGIVGAILDNDAKPGTDEDEGDIVKITFCINETDVTALEVIGGILGQTRGVFDYQITHCVNKGDLFANRESGAAYYLGGIFGYAERGSQTIGNFRNRIFSCYNTGDLSTLNTTGVCYVGGIAGYLRAQTGSEIDIKNCYDHSARKISTTTPETSLKNAGIVGYADGNTLTKFMSICYAVNAEDSEALFTSLYLWGKGFSSQVNDSTVLLLTNVNDESFDVEGTPTTMAAEMRRIDQAIAKLTPLFGNACEHVYDNDCDADCNVCGEAREISDHVYDNDQDTTCNVCGETRTVETAPTPQDTTPDTTTAPAEEKKGCGSALNSTYAVIALVAVLGFAFVAKKKEEN